MTAQINDDFVFRKKRYALAGISQGELFDISVLDLKPSMASTACWRGYQCVYGLRESRLVLADLHVNLYQESADPREYKREVGPPINGVSPRAAKKKNYDFFNNHYLGIELPLEYTGGLLLADEFIQELYVHMGYHAAWKYQDVWELIFENGALCAEHDRSSKMAEIRELFADPDLDPMEWGLAPRSDIQDFIFRAFDRKYEM